MRRFGTPAASAPKPRGIAGNGQQWDNQSSDETTRLVLIFRCRSEAVPCEPPGSRRGNAELATVA